MNGYFGLACNMAGIFMWKQGPGKRLNLFSVNLQYKLELKHFGYY